MKKLKNRIRERLARETGVVRKDPGGRVRVALVYPNEYPLGMGNLGFQTLYGLFNAEDNCVCERAFLPSKEEIEEHRRSSTPLFSYETGTPLSRFDIIAFSLSFEQDYVNIPGILELAGLSTNAVDRDASSSPAHPGPPAPLVMAGGVAVSLNPEPITDFIDLFMIGEAEGAIAPLIEVYVSAGGGSAPKRELLERLATLEGVYVPTLKRAGPIRAIKNLDLDQYPVPASRITTPETVFKDTYLAEVERGCPRGCRFCGAGFLYLPPRWRDPGKVKDAVERGIEASGKVGLVGTAVSEYPDLAEVLRYGIEKGARLTLSSLRIDTLTPELVELLKESGYTTMTLAPEAGSERMRRVVNKGMSDADILDAIRLVTEAGFTRLKLYFMVGLPTEIDADAEAIVELAMRIRETMKIGRLAISVNPFIPKPFTPFQWHPFEWTDIIDASIYIIKKPLVRDPGVTVKAYSSKEAFFQSYLARAGREAGLVIKEAATSGWKMALKNNRALIEESVYRERKEDEELEWEIIDHGVTREYLWSEYQKGLSGELTPPCEVGACFRCGVC